MTFDPGKVSVRVGADHEGTAAVSVACARPNVSVVLRGQPADQAVALVPLLFSLCGRAQGQAARLALAAARGQPAAPRFEAAIADEAAGEHLWRLLLDWPPLLGQAAERALFVEARKRRVQEDFPTWAERSLAPVFDRLRASLASMPGPPPPPVVLLPPLAAAESRAEWPCLDEAFARMPNWRGQAVETGAIARQRPAADAPTLADRFAARCVEVLRPPGMASAEPVAPGVGRAVVDTARGTLMHEITLDGDRIADYVIVAPTEWNFHPGGTLPRWLTGVGGTTNHPLVARVVLSLDPCVPWTIE